MAVLLILWPIAELFVAIEVARAIGVLETILLLILSWPLGIWAVRTQGAAAWRRLTVTMAERRAPGRELLDGALVLLGGLLLVVPGFLTDVFGLVLLFPPTRAALRPLLARNLHSRVFVRAARFTGQPYDIDSTAHDIDQPRLRR
ncbi:MAG: protein FxsA [Solirubrobacteraceae bacterium]|jgi:UPF0716 protein FxsA|nr:protein FxsA [Solirubrobacteraceae bacterium]